MIALKARESQSKIEHALTEREYWHRCTGLGTAGRKETKMIR